MGTEREGEEEILIARTGFFVGAEIILQQVGISLVGGGEGGAGRGFSKSRAKGGGRILFLGFQKTTMEIGLFGNCVDGRFSLGGGRIFSV